MHSEQFLIGKDEQARQKMQNRGEISLTPCALLKLSQGFSIPKVNLLKPEEKGSQLCILTQI